jgi:hypothetical protein
MKDLVVKTIVSAEQVETVAEIVADVFRDQHYQDFSQGHEYIQLFDFIGLDLTDLSQALAANSLFQNLICTYVQKYGLQFFDEPYEYWDIEEVDEVLMAVPGYKALATWAQDAADIFNNAIYSRDTGIDDDCARAIQVLKAAGFKMVRT